MLPGASQAHFQHRSQPSHPVKDRQICSSDQKDPVESLQNGLKRHKTQISAKKGMERLKTHR